MRRGVRGFTLLEAVVVLAITVTVLLTALPVMVSLLREERGLAADVLRGDTLPQLHARIDRDLSNAGSLAAGLDPETHATVLTLLPRAAAAETAPTIVWTLAGASLERRERPADGSDGPPPHTWKVEGALALEPGELAAGRLGLLWRPARGPAELLVFEPPREDEVLR